MLSFNFIIFFYLNNYYEFFIKFISYFILFFLFFIQITLNEQDLEWSNFKIISANDTHKNGEPI